MMSVQPVGKRTRERDLISVHKRRHYGVNFMCGMLENVVVAPAV